MIKIVLNCKLKVKLLASKIVIKCQSNVTLYIEILTAKVVNTVSWCNITAYSAEHSLPKIF